MEIAVFYTNGSSQIVVDLYGNEDVKVSLIANKVEQDSVNVSKSFFYNNKAHVVFNSLMYKYDKYTVVATTSNETISKTPNFVEAPTSKYETNYIEDTLTSKTKDTIKEIVAKPIFEEKGNYLIVDFEDTKLVTIGNALVIYSGGGNRYLNNKDGLLVLQKDSCIDINDTYSPNVINTVFKVENECTNLFNGTITKPIGNAQVQKGIDANVFTSFNGELNIDFKPIEFNGSQYCFSALMCVQEPTTCSLYYLDENEQEYSIESIDEDMEVEPTKVTLDKEYEMISFNFSLNGNYKLRLKVDVFGKSYNKLFLLLPQIEISPYPTSRVLNNETREKDFLTVLPYSTTNMNEGGFVEVEAIFGRKVTRSEGCVVLEWIDENGNGLRILQDEDNSIIACINEGGNIDSVTSAYIEISEGESIKVRVEYNKDLITLKVNDNEYSCERINFKGFPDVKNEIHVGHSENIPSFDGDFKSIKFGK